MGVRVPPPAFQRTATFEWLEGGHVLIQRSHVDDERFPAKLRPDTFEGLAQLAETPGDWVDDLKIIFRRRAPG